MIAYLVNAVLFILVGLQLHPILGGVTGRSASALLAMGAAISAVVIVVRLAWMFTVPYVIRLLDRRPAQVARRAPASERLVVGWSGMRGAVSLAAALALPLESAGSEGFPQRNLIVFLTFAVIFATLVVQGLTLPVLIRRLRLRGDTADEEEELRARLGATDAALARLEELGAEDWTLDDTIDRLRGLYEYRHRRLSARAGLVEDAGYETRSLAYQRVLRELLEAQRRAIVGLRNEGAISNDVMHRVERDLDLEDSRLEI
jgi:CPA1 family monovalent cation:H+ antiporter